MPVSSQIQQDTLRPPKPNSFPNVDETKQTETITMDKRTNPPKRPSIQLDDWQKDFIKTKGDKILCCGRQVGKTEICAHDCGEYVQNPDNPHPVLMTAPTERQAYNLFDKTLSYLLEHYPKTIKMGKDRPTKSKITLKDKNNPKKAGMLIYCLPTGVTGLGIRGITVGRSYEDENSRTPEEVEQACLTNTEDISANKNNITIFPNPAKKELFISSKNGIKLNELSIYNQVGRKVLYKKYATHTIDISMLRQGMYIIELETNKSRIREKLIIK